MGTLIRQLSAFRYSIGGSRRTRAWWRPSWSGPPSSPATLPCSSKGARPRPAPSPEPAAQTTVVEGFRAPRGFSKVTDPCDLEKLLRAGVPSPSG